MATIGMAIQKPDNWVYVYDPSNKLIARITGQLQGYTSTVVTVKRGAWFYMHDATGKMIGQRSS